MYDKVSSDVSQVYSLASAQTYSLTVLHYYFALGGGGSSDVLLAVGGFTYLLPFVCL